MGGGKKKNRRNSAWVGKYRILVKTWIRGVRSEFFVVDLKQQMIVMKHPEVVWSDNYFKSTAVLHKGTLSVLNIGVYNFTNSAESPPIVVNEQQDYIHFDSDTCTSTLDLTVTPPIWSNWTPAPKMNFKRLLPYWAAIDSKIFAFHGTRFNSINPEFYQIGCGGGSSDKWEEITIPFGGDLTPYDPAWLSIPPISDPNNNRFIAYFDNKKSLYAYYPNNNKWELLHQHLPRGKTVFLASAVADQVVGGSLILCFNPNDQIFMAYDIFTNKWLNNVDWLCKFDPDKMYFGSQSQLVHLGNDILCLAVSYKEYPDHKTVIQFIRFSVKLVEEELVQLTTLSFHPIFIDNIYSLADTFIHF